MPRLRFGPSIKKSRVRLGMTQTELGQKLQPPRGPETISQWENEEGAPSNEQKVQLRRILGQTSNDRDTVESQVAADDTERVAAPSAIGAWLNKHRLEQNFSVPELASK